jgi:tetratricopeptide (TPR) repeat protein
LSLLQAASRMLPGQPDLLHDLAWCYFATGNAVQAQATMESAVQTGLPFAKLDDAKQFLSMLEVAGNPAEGQAAAKVQRVLQTDTNYVPALLASALVQDHLGRTKEAEQLYEKVLAAYPLFTGADRQLTILYARNGEYDKAYAIAAQARAAFPADAELAKYAGIAAYHQKDYQTAGQCLTQSAGTYHDDAEVFYYLGMTDYQTQQYSDSKKVLQRAVALKLPNDLATEAARVLALPQLK